MKPSKGSSALIAATSLIAIGASVSFYFGSDDAEPQQPDFIERAQTTSHTSPQVAAAQVETRLSAAKNEAADDSDLEQENPYFNREVKARLAQVADVYAEQIRYPAFSMPIPNREALGKYLPNRSFAAERPLDIEDESSPRIRLLTDKQQYFTGDIIKVTVSLDGLTGDPFVKVQARLLAKGQTLVTAEATATDQQATTYQMSFADLDAIAHSETDEYRVAARVNVDGKEYEIGTPVSYVDSVAMVTHVGLAQISGEYLYIPVDVTTTKPGYHELGANLYGVQSGEPLVHLSVQQELQANNGLLQLRAHISSLKVKGDPGPYRLQDITFTRMPSPPDFTTEYGKPSQDSYEVNGYSFDEYDDVLYVDQEAQERLEFMRQLSRVE